MAARPAPTPVEIDEMHHVDSMLVRWLHDETHVGGRWNAARSRKQGRRIAVVVLSDRAHGQRTFHEVRAAKSGRSGERQTRRDQSDTTATTERSEGEEGRQQAARSSAPSVIVSSSSVRHCLPFSHVPPLCCARGRRTPFMMQLGWCLRAATRGRTTQRQAQRRMTRGGGSATRGSGAEREATAAHSAHEAQTER